MPSIFMTSLGCAKNLVDAETTLGETLGGEFTLSLDPEAADLIIINTCGFIEEARDEARETIRGCLELKRRAGGRPRVVATGCWAERDPKGVLAEFPGLDAVWGLRTPASLREAIGKLEAGAGGISGLGARDGAREGARLISTPPSYAYLRLSDGCDNRCAYCAIPSIRGRLASRDPGRIVDEAKVLEEGGIKELILIGQDTTAYGRDLGRPGASLPRLLEKLLKAVRLPRLRLLYTHPAHLEADVLDLMLGQPRLCGYVDFPAQHASESILRRMGRGYGRERVLELLDRFAAGGLTVRGTLLLGFPGETEADFLEALDLAASGAFQHLGAFAYSPEPGTPAFDLDGRVPPAEAARRRDAVLASQQSRAFAWLESRIGGREEILVDRLDGKGRPIGRSVREAPDVDGTIRLSGSRAAPGEIIDACVTRREGYDLLADAGGRRHGKPREGRGEKA